MTSVDALLRTAACAHGAAPALLLRDDVLSYDEVAAAVERLAGQLAARVAPGDRVAHWGPKDRLACLLPLAIARAGAVSVPIAPVLKAPQAWHIVTDSRASLLIAARARVGDETFAPAAIVEPADLAEHAPVLPVGAPMQDDHTLAALLYTSGSTGRPKGVMLSHRNLTLGADSVARFTGLSVGDVILGLLPLSFDYGLNQWLGALAVGAAYAPVDYWSAADAVRAADRVGATVIAGVPPLWRQLVAADWPEHAAARVRIVTNSGGALTPALIAALRRTFPNAAIHAMYGLTEAFRSTSLPPDRLAAKPASVGQAVPHAEVLVCRPDGEETAVGEEGELVHAGPLVAMGYWNDPGATARRFRPAPHAARSGGTAVWSGDRFVRDADGDLHFAGRGDAMIKAGGYRISPAELEEPAMACGLVREAVAFAITDADGEARLCLAVEGQEGDTDALATILRRDLPTYLQPQRIILLPAFPRTASGKIDRPAVTAAAGALAVAG